MEEYVVFAFIVDGDVFHTFEVERGSGTDRLIAGLRSNPIIVEVSENLDIAGKPGWHYIDGKFIQDEKYLDTDDYEVED